MSGTNNFDKKYFLSTNWDNTNFHHFCKVRACRYSFKNSNFQKLPKIVEKHFLWWVEQIILTKKNFLAQIEIKLIFAIFCKVRACRYSFKISNFQKLPKIVEKHFLWWVEQIILTKKYFHSTNWDKTNFHHYCKVRACRYSFKKSNFQKLPCGETLPLISGTNNFDKKYFLSRNWNKTNFHHFCKVRPCRYSFKN